MQGNTLYCKCMELIEITSPDSELLPNISEEDIVTVRKGAQMASVMLVANTLLLYCSVPLI